MVASHYVLQETDSSGNQYCNFIIRNVNGKNELSGKNLCHLNSANSTWGNLYKVGLRPCFSLKTNIKITGGDGSKETPYTME